MTPDEAIEQARWYEREDIATTLRESANVLANECERLRNENTELATRVEVAERDVPALWRCPSCGEELLPVSHAELRHKNSALANECERLRERVRVLEEALRAIVAPDDGCQFSYGAGCDHSCRATARAALAKGGE